MASATIPSSCGSLNDLKLRPDLLGLRLLDAGLVGGHLRRPLLHVLFGTGALLGQTGRELELVHRVVEIGLELCDLLSVDRRVGLQYQHILLRFRELRVELPDLELVGTAVELEQRLPLLHRHVGLHQHRGDQRGFRETGNQLDRVLDDPRLGGERRHEAQPDQEDEQQVHREERGEEAPRDGELEPLVLEKDQPDDEGVAEQQGKSEQHVLTRSGLLDAVGWRGARRGVARRRR